MKQDDQHQRKEFDKELVRDGQYLNTNLNCYNRKIKTDFHGKKPPKEKSTCLCLPGQIVLDLVCKIKTKVINFTHRFIWKSVSIKKRNKLKKETHKRNNNNKTDESEDESTNKSSSFQKKKKTNCCFGLL